MRRLPVYFLIDVSESMVGEPIRHVEEGLRTIITSLRQDPYALETVYISIIVFAGKTQKLVPLTDLMSFYPPELPIGGGTSLGNAIQFLINELDSALVKTTTEVKGDWKPLIFMFSDGTPTDQVDDAIRKWENRYKNKTQLVAISFGDSAGQEMLKRLTEEVLVFNNADSNSYKKFFKWITASIQTHSSELNVSGKANSQFADLDASILKKASSRATHGLDSNFAVFVAKCQSNQSLYLIKYKKEPGQTTFFDLVFPKGGFRLIGSYPIKPNYFQLSDTAGSQTTPLVNTNELSGCPTCPCCGNQYGFSICSCGNAFCIDKVGMNLCPWCNTENHFDFHGGIQVKRAKG